MSESRIIHGFHAVTARLRQKAGSVLEIYLDAAREDARAQELVRQAQERGVRVLRVDHTRLGGIAGTGKHQGVVARVAASEPGATLDAVLDALGEPALLLVLDGVQDSHNLGACLRVADAFGVHAVIAPKDRAVGITATVSRVASGAAETVPYLAVTNLARTMRELQEREIWLVGADQQAARDLFAAKLGGPMAWVLGAEGEGLRRLTRERCDELVRIPMIGSVESLNVSVASGVCLFETRRQRSIGA